MKKFFRLLLSIGICESAGIIGSFFTLSSVKTWYLSLNKPFFNPPSWLFGPVWTILYILIGVSLYLVWGKKKLDLKWFWIQLGLNTFWSIIFFGLKSPLFAFILIIFLWMSIFLTIREFQKTNKVSAYLLYPYLVWVSFASILNLAIVILNR